MTTTDATTTWFTFVIQLPSILTLFFNVFASLGAITLTGILTALHILDKQEDGTVTFPIVLQPRYQPPRTTDLAWAAVGGLLFRWSFDWILVWYSARAALGDWYNMSLIVVTLAGIWFALIRLDCWRLFVADFLREVHRIIEMDILNQVLAECCQEKISNNSSSTLKMRRSGSVSKDDDRLHVLDFGGGKGKTTEHMLEKCKDTVAKVNAIDIEAHPPHVVEYDGATIPFPSNSFDLSVAM